jgi:cytochrome P450
MQESDTEILQKVAGFDPFDPPPAMCVDPYPLYHALRSMDPVHHCPNGSYFLTRHADLRRIYKDARSFSSDKRVQFKPLFDDSLLYEHHTTSLVFNDPPLHTHVRKAFGSALSPKAIEAMEKDVRVLVERLLGEVEEKRGFDLIADFASVIPVEVIGNLLRVPHEERGPLRGWSAAILGALEFKLSAEQLEAGNRAVREFLDYLENLVADRRRNLSDDHDDILSRLIRWESEGFTLSDKQLYHQCIFLLNAGHETTTNLIGNGIHALLTHPEQLQRLREQPDLIDSAVEEMLRYESPVQLGNRLTTTAVEFGDTAIPAGTILTLCIGAANRDPEVYDLPDRFDITRNPVDHLAFGGGIHTCAGLNVARLEARIAISRLVQNFPGLRLNGEVVRDQRMRFRGFLSLPMVVE